MTASRIIRWAARVGLYFSIVLCLVAVRRAAVVDLPSPAAASATAGVRVDAIEGAVHSRGEADLLVAAELDPFRPERQPPPVLPDASEEDGHPGEPPVEAHYIELRLFGTSTGDIASAVVGAGGASPRVLQVGDTVYGFHVERIGAAEATLVSRDSTMLLRVALPGGNTDDM